jgi:hypothetical protein
VLPTLIIVGLMAIPYIDTNPRGNGYYSFRERKWELGIFLYGFLVLWSFLIITGTFLRGPNWNFFGPLRILGPEQARAARQRRSLRADLGEDAGHAAAEALGDPRAPGSSSCSRTSACRRCWRIGAVPPLLLKMGAALTTSAPTAF